MDSTLQPGKIETFEEKLAHPEVQFIHEDESGLDLDSMTNFEKNYLSDNVYNPLELDGLNNENNEHSSHSFLCSTILS